MLLFALLPDAQRLTDQLAGGCKISCLDALFDKPVHLRRERNADFFGCGLLWAEVPSRTIRAVPTPRNGRLFFQIVPMDEIFDMLFGPAARGAEDFLRVHADAHRQVHSGGAGRAAEACTGRSGTA